MFDRYKRKKLADEINVLRKRKNTLIEKNNEIKTDIKKTVNNTYNVNKTGGMGIPYGYCPYASPNFDIEFSDEPNEPMGWKKGTVRAIITMWVIFTTCLIAVCMMLLPWIPISLKAQFFQWWLVIAGIVISSYFVTRLKSGMFTGKMF